MKVNVLLTFTTVLAVFVKTGFSIECYVCNSHYDKSCMHTFVDSQYKQNCSEVRGPEWTACRKSVQYFTITINGVVPEERVVRACAMNFTDEKPCVARTSESGYGHSCHCFEDNCNSAPTSSKSMAAILIFSLFVRYFWFTNYKSVHVLSREICFNNLVLSIYEF